MRTKSLLSFDYTTARPPRSGGITSSYAGIRALRESLGDELPIVSPRDKWTRVADKGGSHIKRRFETRDAQHLKMLICDIADIQERTQHEIEVDIRGLAVEVRTTTHELGEPTEIDRDIAREIDACYDEVVEVHR